jgi:hypothetical protein
MSIYILKLRRNSTGVPYSFVSEASSCRHCHCRFRCSPLATTTTTVAPWLIVDVFVLIVSSSALPSPPPPPLFCDLFDCYVVVSSPPYCCAFLLLLHPFHHHPSFVDCCFKRRTKPLLSTMVSSLLSRPSALVGCFRCPPPPTLAASHGSRCQLSVALTAGASTSPSPCPPLVAATPPAVLPLCGVFRTLAARLMDRPYNPPPLG